MESKATHADPAFHVTLTTATASQPTEYSTNEQRNHFKLTAAWHISLLSVYSSIAKCFPNQVNIKIVNIRIILSALSR